jgi:hypothetical protein
MLPPGSASHCLLPAQTTAVEPWRSTIQPPMCCTSSQRRCAGGMVRQVGGRDACGVSRVGVAVMGGDRRPFTGRTTTGRRGSGADVAFGVAGTSMAGLEVLTEVRGRAIGEEEWRRWEVKWLQQRLTFQLMEIGKMLSIEWLKITDDVVARDFREWTLVSHRNRGIVDVLLWLPTKDCSYVLLLRAI